MIASLVVILALLAGMLGASLASFLCVVAERTVRGESITGRSHCVCGRRLASHENVPVVGWLSVRGRARCCGASLPPHYLWWEVVFFLTYAALAVRVTYRTVLTQQGLDPYVFPMLVATLLGLSSLLVFWERSRAQGRR